MKCIGLFGAVFGHSYGGRYSEAFPEGRDFSTGRFEGTAGAYEIMVNAWKERTYHGDICTRCGHTINAPKEAA